MMNTNKKVISLAAFLLALAVVLGAFGAHALEKSLTPKAMKTYQTGLNYFYYHSFALILYSLSCQAFKLKTSKLTIGFFLLGIFLFSGNCILYAVSSSKIFAMIVPLGGLCFIIAWGSFAKSFFKN